MMVPTGWGPAGDGDRVTEIEARAPVESSTNPIKQRLRRWPLMVLATLLISHFLQFDDRTGSWICLELIGIDSPRISPIPSSRTCRPDGKRTDTTKPWRRLRSQPRTRICLDRDLH